MRIYLCGQKAFGAEVLEKIMAAGHEVSGVSAPPGDRLWNAAARHSLPALPAGALNADTLPSNVDLIVAAHSHDFIGRRTRLKARLGAIGYHPSLLPKHRGRDAIRWTVHMRDTVTGGTVYWLSDTMDGGDIAAQDWCFVPPQATPESLWRELLFPMGVRLLDNVISDLQDGVLVAIPQDKNHVTWEPSWERPPAHRPDLTMIGSGLDGYRVVRDPNDLRRTA